LVKKTLLVLAIVSCLALPAALPAASTATTTTTANPATASHKKLKRVRHHRRRVVHHAAAGAHHAKTSKSRRRATRRYASTRRTSAHHTTRRRVIHHWSPWIVSSFGNPTAGDIAVGEDPQIREAAIQAIGNWNGAVVVVNPENGRILSIVNQGLALTGAYIPCSTVKPMVALAGLREGIVTPQTKLVGMHGRPVNMTEALAHSDNLYFAKVGEMLGFARVSKYAHELGYGQPAGWSIAGETAGRFPSAPPEPGGVGLLTSFGTGIDVTALQMAALISAVANGGTLYYLQYPRTLEQVAQFQPRVRRQLTNLAPFIPEIKPGLAGAVEYGTARSAYNGGESIFGKTGTCSEDGGRMGWFVSYSTTQQQRYVIVVMLRGGRPMFGPHAAEIAGKVYRNLLLHDQESAEAGQVPALITRPRRAVN
jgi:penicillin-binding protein 2